MVGTPVVVGTVANDGTGDPLRTAMQTINANFALAAPLASPTFTGVVTVQAGSVTAPAITTTGDTNTGIYFPAADNVAITAGGVAAAQFKNGSTINCAIFSNTGTPSPFGITISYTAAAPNDTSKEFVFCQDSAAPRFVARSNGGLANFSANNVNLSDIRVKPEFEEHTTGDLDALEAAFVAVDWGRYKYTDQTHDDWNFGYSAQGVEAAFATVVPTITDVWNPTTKETEEVEVGGITHIVTRNVDTPVDKQLKAVYTEDLNNIAHALLARALTHIRALAARIVALESK